MKEITFIPRGFKPGHSYIAELVFNGEVVDTITSLIENSTYIFSTTVPGTYTIRIVNSLENSCLSSRIVQALYPIVEYTTTDVDCVNNTYNVIINLTNPDTAGIGVLYGWSLQNDCSTVSQWNSDSNISLPADDIPRFIFVKNQSQLCCSLITASVKSPCITCNLEIVNIVFSCNG